MGWIYDNRVFLFSYLQTTQYQLKINGHLLVFEHGDRLAPALDGVLKIKKSPAFLQKRLINFHDRMLKKYGKEFLRRFFSKRNKTIKKRLKTNSKNGEFFICGHTHYPEIDKENRFANCGTIGGEFGSYLLIDEKGKIEVREENYDVNSQPHKH